MGTEGHGHLWINMDNDVKKKGNFLHIQHTKNREHRLCEGELFFFLSHLNTNTPVVEKRKSSKGKKNVGDNVCFLNLVIFICGNKEIKTLFWSV